MYTHTYVEAGNRTQVPLMCGGTAVRLTLLALDYIGFKVGHNRMPLILVTGYLLIFYNSALPYSGEDYT